MKVPYNTALKVTGSDSVERNRYKEIDWFENNRGIVFYHDMATAPTPAKMEAFKRAKCIYAEPSWPDGFSKFATKAGVIQSGTYHQFITGIRKLVEQLCVPTYVLAGRSFIKILCPDEITSIRLKSARAEVILAIWNAQKPLQTDNESLIEALAQKYDTVLDFCCGYGKTLRQFKHFIGSDIDRTCLGYIVKEIMQGDT